MTQPDVRPPGAAPDASPTAVPVPTSGDRSGGASHPQINLSPGKTTRHRWFSMRRPILWVILAMAVPLAATTFVLLTSGGSSSQADARGNNTQVTPGQVASPDPAASGRGGVQHRGSAIRRTSPHTS
jgi:hypothetical protein